MPFGADDTPLAVAAVITVGVLFVHLGLAVFDMCTSYARSYSVRFFDVMFAAVVGSNVLGLAWILVRLVMAPGGPAPAP